MALTAERVRLPHRFTPRDYQVPFLASFPHRRRYAGLVVHRRGGKDLTAFSAVMVPEAAETVGTYYYFLPTIAHARKVIWDGMDNEGLPSSPASQAPARRQARPNPRCASNWSTARPSSSSAATTTTPSSAPIRAASSSRSTRSATRAAGSPSGPSFAATELAGFLYTPRGANHGLDLLDVARDNWASGSRKS